VANRILSAAATLRDAAPHFRRARSPYADWAAIYGAVADRANGDNAAAGRDLESIPPQDLTAFQYLRARAAWLGGLIHMSAGHLDEAGQQYSDALSDLLGGGETEGVIAMRSVIAEYSFYVGDSEQAWRMSHQALALLDQTRSTDRRELTLIIAGFLASWQELPEAALHFESAYVDLARREHDATNIPEALTHRAQTYERLGLHDRATADLQAATAALPDVPDTALRERRANELRVAIGTVDRRSDPERASAELTRALDFFEKGQFSLRGVRLHLARGRVAMSAGRGDEARRDYLTGIEEFERQRVGWTTEQTRLSSFDEAWSLFDEMIRLESARSDAHGAAALEIAERGRAQALLDAIRGPVRSRVPLTALQRRLGSNADVLFYATLDEALFVWHITADAVTSARIPMDRADLERRIRRFTSAIERDDARAVRALGRTLFSTLVGPVARTLHPDRPLVVIGDGVIQRIPFAALVTDSGRYLVEERSIAWSPSLSVYASEPISSMDRSLGGALVVVPPTAREDVAPLPGAEAEGREVARQYTGAALLTGDGADVTRFLAAARGARVLHFAGHSVVNPRYPAMSYLQLGGSTPATGRLFATTIAAQDFSHADLVVLASCSSAAGKQVRGEGVLSLARPFLAGGAAAVVAALWDLDDREAEPFFSAFHERYAAGDSAVDALRAAQLRYVARAEPRTLRVWASVMVSGRAQGLFGRGAHRR
jgi:CHAT domain-containing protein